MAAGHVSEHTPFQRKYVIFFVQKNGHGSQEGVLGFHMMSRPARTLRVSLNKETVAILVPQVHPPAIEPYS